MIYHSPDWVDIPNVDLLTFLFDTTHSRSKEDTVLHAEAHDPSRAITKAQARKLTRQFAHFLRSEYGIGRDGPGRDVVMAVSSGQSALPCLFFGIIAAEGVYSAGSPMNTTSDLARQLRDGPCKVLVCSRELLETAVAAAAEAGLSRRHVLVLESYPEIRLYSADGAVSCGFDGELGWRVVRDSDELEKSTICLMYSSGTTGLPKGVLLSHKNIVAEVFLLTRVARQHWDKQEAWPWRRSVAHLPTAHIAGLIQYFCSHMLDGTTTYWMPKFNFDDFVRYTEQFQINFLLSVPPVYLAIAKHPGVRAQFAQINQAIVGAAPISREAHVEANRKMPKAVMAQVWGLSETSGAATCTPEASERHVGTLGVLLPTVSARLVDEDGEDVPEGEAGEMLIKGPIVTKGYHNNPEASKNAFTADGWLRTGDIMRIDSDKAFHIVDRKKELIKYKGLQVAPAELEGILEGHPSVADVGVIGVPLGDTEAPRAFVVLTPAAQSRSVSVEELTRYVQDRVADYKRLRGGMEIVENVPRSPSGKILRRQLREAYSRRSRL